MSEKKSIVRVINQNNEIYFKANEKEVEDFKFRIRELMKNPSLFYIEIVDDNNEPILFTKGFIQNSYVKIESIKNNDLRKVASLI